MTALAFDVAAAKAELGVATEIVEKLAQLEQAGRERVLAYVDKLFGVAGRPRDPDGDDPCMIRASGSATMGSGRPRDPEYGDDEPDERKPSKRRAECDCEAAETLRRRRRADRERRSRSRRRNHADDKNRPQTVCRHSEDSLKTRLKTSPPTPPPTTTTKDHEFVVVCENKKDEGTRTARASSADRPQTTTPVSADNTQSPSSADRSSADTHPSLLKAIKASRKLRALHDQPDPVADHVLPFWPEDCSVDAVERAIRQAAADIEDGADARKCGKVLRSYVERATEPPGPGLSKAKRKKSFWQRGNRLVQPPAGDPHYDGAMGWDCVNLVE